LRNLHAALPDLHAGFTRADHVVFVHLVGDTLARLAAPRLDVEIARPALVALGSRTSADTERLRR
jgi:hypothetical protein